MCVCVCVCVCACVDCHWQHYWAVQDSSGMLSDVQARGAEGRGGTFKWKVFSALMWQRVYEHTLFLNVQVLLVYISDQLNFWPVHLLQFPALQQGSNLWRWSFTNPQCVTRQKKRQQDRSRTQGARGLLADIHMGAEKWGSWKILFKWICTCFRKEICSTDL